MKKIFLSLVSLLTFGATQAQVYNELNSLVRKALVLYEKDSKGFYIKKENVEFPTVSNIVSSYAYIKKSHELYAQTANANFVITVGDNYAKFLKRNNSIPQLKDEKLDEAISKVNSQLEEKYTELNRLRQKQIEDSIAKAKRDSINKAKQDSINFVQISQQKEKYRKSHKWSDVPIANISLSCSLCDKTIYGKDSLFCIGFKNDTLFHVTIEDLALGQTYVEVHPISVPQKLKDNSRFKFHFDVYGDSLRDCKIKSFIEEPKYSNYLSYLNAMDDVKKIAPYGYFDNWGWNSEYGSVSFHFEYTNTNKATIKYIDVYWTITNDVNDVRKTGHFKGTGPLEEWKSARWNWDYSSYYVAGDATNMVITKVILTYTNGTTKTLTKSMLHFN